MTAVAAFGSFSLAQHWGVSGVLATVTAGLLLGNVGILSGEDDRAISPRGREVVIAFWDFAAFAANSLIFLLIGLDVARRSFDRLGAGALCLAILLTLLGRAVSVYSLCLPFARTRLAIPLPQQHLLVLGRNARRPGPDSACGVPGS